MIATTTAKIPISALSTSESPDPSHPIKTALTRRANPTVKSVAGIRGLINASTTVGAIGVSWPAASRPLVQVLLRGFAADLNILFNYIRHGQW